MVRLNIDDWELKDMIATRPTEAYAYIRELEKEIKRLYADTGTIYVDKITMYTIPQDE